MGPPKFPLLSNSGFILILTSMELSLKSLICAFDHNLVLEPNVLLLFTLSGIKFPLTLIFVTLKSRI